DFDLWIERCWLVDRIGPGARGRCRLRDRPSRWWRRHCFGRRCTIREESEQKQRSYGHGSSLTPNTLQQFHHERMSSSVPCFPSGPTDLTLRPLSSHVITSG